MPFIKMTSNIDIYCDSHNHILKKRLRRKNQNFQADTLLNIAKKTQQTRKGK